MHKGGLFRQSVSWQFCRKIPADYKDTIIEAIQDLATNPRQQGKRTKKLAGELIVPQFVAECRLRVGPYRVLYDIDDQHKKVVLLKLAKRDEQTYN